MTKHVVVAGIRFVTIEAEDERICRQCGKFAETRPYGKGGMRICFQCGMADLAETERQFGTLIGVKEQK